ncbi:MAG: hypothetical protein WBO46_26680 [Caldilineaceae bacterium]
MGEMQTPIAIGKVIQNAVVFDFKNWAVPPMNSDSVPQSVTHLFGLLQQRQIDYLLVGGVALLTYIEGRNTQDIDLIMALSSLESVPEIIVSSQDMYFARGEFEGLQIDILLTDNPLFDKVRQKYTTERDFVEQTIPTATVEGLLLLKLYALPSLYRQGSFARVGIYENDVATLLHDFSVDVEALYAELSAHLSTTDMAEVRGIVAEIQQRIERFQQPRRTGGIKRDMECMPMTSRHLKYEPLELHLRSIPQDIEAVNLTFTEVERILGTSLPDSASSYREWWSNQRDTSKRPQAHAWQSAGFEVDTVTLDKTNGHVCFRRK